MHLLTNRKNNEKCLVFRGKSSPSKKVLIIKKTNNYMTFYL